MSEKIEKGAILLQVRAELSRQLVALAQALQSATDGATDDQAKPENKYDTRALELSYLAAGQTDRIEALRQVIGQLAFWKPPQGMTAAGPGALIRAEGQRAAPWLFIVPFSASMAVQVGGQTVQVLSAQAPLAKALLGKQAGDIVVWGAGPQLREIEILAVDPSA